MTGQLHEPVPLALQTQSLQLDSMLQLPGPLQSMVQSPPAHFRFVEPAPVEVTLQPPCAQSRLHAPVPLHEKLQPLPAHAQSHAPAPSQVHVAPAAHDRLSGFVIRTSPAPGSPGADAGVPLEPPEDEPDDVSGARFSTVHAMTREERAKNEMSARIMASG